ncbi:hypothetical protein TNCV_4864921 [Trichonephila clavipes]|nr:hypothetical protein TNCV_4864921 [Trichonephila clavipes]
MSLLKKYGAFFNPKLILRGRYVPKLVQKAAYRCAVLLKVTRSPSSSGSIQCSITNVSGVRKFSHTPTLTVYTLYFRAIQFVTLKELTEDVCPIRSLPLNIRLVRVVSTFDEIAQQGYSVDDTQNYA